MSVSKRYSHVIGFDDAPFPREHRGDVLIVGAVFAGSRLEGVLSGRVRRDGVNSTKVLIELISRSRFRRQLQAILLQGIAFGGFNVVDLPALHGVLGIPVLAIARRRPDYAAIRRTLLAQIPGGRRKWALIEKPGPMQPIAGLYVQRVGLSAADAGELVRRFALNSALPEPLRTAHLIAGGVGAGESRHRA